MDIGHSGLVVLKGKQRGKHFSMFGVVLFCELQYDAQALFVLDWC